MADHFSTGLQPAQPRCIHPRFTRADVDARIHGETPIYACDSCGYKSAAPHRELVQPAPGLRWVTSDPDRADSKDGKGNPIALVDHNGQHVEPILCPECGTAEIARDCGTVGGPVNTRILTCKSGHHWNHDPVQIIPPWWIRDYQQPGAVGGGTDWANIDMVVRPGAESGAVVQVTRPGGSVTGGLVPVACLGCGCRFGLPGAIVGGVICCPVCEERHNVHKTTQGLELSPAVRPSPAFIGATLADLEALAGRLEALKLGTPTGTKRAQGRMTGQNDGLTIAVTEVEALTERIRTGQPADRTPYPADDIAPLKALAAKMADVVLDKLQQSGAKYGFYNEWMKDDWRDQLLVDLRTHVDKGDPRDVAAYCAFAIWHGWTISDEPGYFTETRRKAAFFDEIKAILGNRTAFDHLQTPAAKIQFLINFCQRLDPGGKILAAFRDGEPWEPIMRARLGTTAVLTTDAGAVLTADALPGSKPISGTFQGLMSQTVTERQATAEVLNDLATETKDKGQILRVKSDGSAVMETPGDALAAIVSEWIANITSDYPIEQFPSLKPLVGGLAMYRAAASVTDPAATASKPVSGFKFGDLVAVAHNGQFTRGVLVPTDPREAKALLGTMFPGSLTAAAPNPADREVTVTLKLKGDWAAETLMTAADELLDDAEFTDDININGEPIPVRRDTLHALFKAVLRYRQAKPIELFKKNRASVVEAMRNYRDGFFGGVSPGWDLARAVAKLLDIDGPDGKRPTADGPGEHETARVAATEAAEDEGHRRQMKAAAQDNTDVQLADHEVIAKCRDNAAAWAEEFARTAKRLGHGDLDQGWLIGWFANAIETAVACRFPNGEALPQGGPPVATPNADGSIPVISLLMFVNRLRVMDTSVLAVQKKFETVGFKIGWEDARAAAADQLLQFIGERPPQQVVTEEGGKIQISDITQLTDVIGLTDCPVCRTYHACRLPQRQPIPQKPQIDITMTDTFNPQMAELEKSFKKVFGPDVVQCGPGWANQNAEGESEQAKTMRTEMDRHNAAGEEWLAKFDHDNRIRWNLVAAVALAVLAFGAAVIVAWQTPDHSERWGLLLILAAILLGYGSKR